MNWPLFEGQLLNVGEFLRFYVEDLALFGTQKSGQEIMLKQYEDPQEARDGLCYLSSRIQGRTERV